MALYNKLIFIYKNHNVVNKKMKLILQNACINRNKITLEYKTLSIHI